MPLAGKEIEEAALWYNSQQKGLGKRFTQTVRDDIKFACKNPLAFALRYKDARAIPMKKFPFLIYYRVSETEKQIIVISVFHVAKDPDKLKNRL